MAVVFAALATLVALPKTAQSRPQQARFTSLTGEVRIVSDSGTRSAAANDAINETESVKTSPGGRAELTFTDKIIARLPANSGLSFKNGTRNLQVTDGAVLLQTPRGAHGARLCDGTIAVALAGTTVLFEHHPSIYKLLVLQGTARLYQPSRLGESMLVQPGQMVIANPAKGLSEAVDFDTAHFIKTCRLITGFTPLPTAAVMAKVGEKQARDKGRKHLIETNLVIYGSGTAVSLVDPGKLPNASGNSANPAGTPPGPVMPAHEPDSLGAVDAARGISR